jgi:inosose dehydratase
VEAGPDGFLPEDPEGMTDLLSGYGLVLVGGFVPVVLHRQETRDAELASVERQARLFGAAGAGVLVIAAATGEEGYEESTDLEDSEWDELFAALAMVEEIGAGQGLGVVLHPHFGTQIESPAQVQRFLDGCDMGLCLDTGHSMVGGGDPVRLAESAAARVRHVHLKDVDRDLAGRVISGTLPYERAVRDGLYMPLGDGDVDVRRVLDALDEAGYDGWYVLEQDIMLAADPGYGPAAEVGRSLAYLKGVLET